MKLKYLIASLLAFIPLSLVSCGGSSTPSESEQVNKIVLTATEVDLVIGESYLLGIAFTDVDPSELTSYTSSNTDIVSVSESGLVVATGPGSATVSVNKGDAEAECNFNVSYGTQVPVIHVDGILNNSLQLDLESSFQLSISVSFSGQSYEISNPEISIEEGGTGAATITNNIVTPTKTGSFILKITGAFRDFILHPYYIDVNVKDAVTFYLRDGSEGFEYNEVNLYSLSEFGGKEYKDSFSPNPAISINGEVFTTGIAIDLIDLDSVVNYNQTTNTITPIKAGVASLRLTYGEYQKSYIVRVNHVFGGNIGNEPYVIDASTGILPSEEIFKDFPGDDKIIKATNLDGTLDYEVVDGKVFGIQANNFEEQQVVVYNSKIAFIVNIKAYTKIIRTPEDLNEFIIDFGEDTSKVQTFRNDGYYVLANDIDCSGYTYPNQTRMLGMSSNQIDANCGFVGTFDGQGHTISNLKAPKGGLFLIIGNGAVIKNVGFKDAVLDTSKDNDKFVLATYIYASDISNIFISSSSLIESVNNAMVAACVTNTCAMYNSLFEFYGDATVNQNFGSFMHVPNTNFNYNPKYLANCHLISEIPMTVANNNRYFDAIDYEIEGWTYNNVPNIKHYLNESEFINSENDFSTFDSRYWDTTTIPGRLIWRD